MIHHHKKRNEAVKKTILFVFLIFSMLANIHSQDTGQAAFAASLRQGITHYGRGNWHEAVEALEPILVSKNNVLAAEAHFWTAMSLFSGGEYLRSLENMETIFLFYSDYYQINELKYHKGRALFHLGFFDEAILTLNEYYNSFGPDMSLDSGDLAKKSSALYWVGECLYAMGHFDRAEDAFLLITSDYPNSAKYEAAFYRIALINQKKIEAELLDLLKWSHEESLRAMEEYRHRESAYEQTILSYQNRINNLQSDTRLAELEADNAMFQLELAFSEERIQSLEARLSEITGLAAEQEQVQAGPLPRTLSLPAKIAGIWDNDTKYPKDGFHFLDIYK